MQCPCGSGKTFETCCEPYIKGTDKAPTAEALMRSRYAAYTLKDVAYLEKTLAPESRGDFDREATREWAGQAKWKGLEIVKTENGGEKDSKGMVEFIAKYEVGGKTLDHHEVSTFRKDSQGRWLFVDGDAHTHEDGQGHHHHAPRETFVRETPKVGRNDACPCGSGKKYKKCCGAAA